MPIEPTRKLHYEIAGPAQAPVLVLANSLGTTLGMWQPQMAAWTARYRVLRHDTRGHGRSPLPAAGAASGFGFDDLAADIVAILDHAGIARAHYCGLSMGGMTGMVLARHHADRFDRFVFANTAAQIGPESVWNARIETVRRGGMDAIVEGVLARWFTDDYRARPDAGIGPVREMLARTDPAGYLANCAAVRDADLRPLLAGIDAEVLVIAGERDLATTAAQGRAVAESIGGAHFLSLDAAHLSNWEVPAAFADAVSNFLALR
ncbi:MAG: 3-oxoadipate enol-lactonase [Cupriavidus sp.]|nr:MAG: 3-oxoadipate enol-lactonase [Cupriavidus sp.]